MVRVIKFDNYPGLSTVYSSRKGRFLNSALPNKKNFAQKSKFIYDKQKALGNRAAMLAPIHWKNNTTNLFH